MLGLSLPAGPLRLACLGAHSDDIEIGAGGTILRLLAEHPGSTVDWFVACADVTRQAEAEASARDLLAAAGSVELRIEQFSENVLPFAGPGLKAAVAEVGASRPHDLVIAPDRRDRHQDHRFLAELAHQTWRDHPIWSYEIPKWDGDLRTPGLYVRLDDAVAEAKLDHLGRHFASQHHRPWYDRDVFAAVLRLRGVECNHRYAEGFHPDKTAL